MDKRLGTVRQLAEGMILELPCLPRGSPEHGNNVLDCHVILIDGFRSFNVRLLPLRSIWKFLFLP
ncbi:hypothetical protein PMI05_01879 [Brevibacillus sp. BC25]|nr:hypothetical protein PMI05_01879 [Brevibacillus sp. BC25]